MSKVAFVFPGQGAQKVGMGADVCNTREDARHVFRAADEALGEKLSTLVFEGPEAALKLTANTQPAILTTSIALLRALGKKPDAVAGHSLGEYSAHVCAGTLAFEDAVRIVRKRGTFMQDAVPVGTGAMAAVMGLDRATLERICREGQGIVEPVNYNSSNQIVIAGEAAAVAGVASAISAAGGKFISLPVSAPFHSSLMLPAEKQLEPVLAQAQFSTPLVPVYVNVDAAPVIDADAARSALVRQVSRPVRWEETIERMVSDGITTFVEIGPGKVLSGLIGRITKTAKRLNVESAKDLDVVRTALS